MPKSRIDRILFPVFDVTEETNPRGRWQAFFVSIPLFAVQLMLTLEFVEHISWRTYLAIMTSFFVSCVIHMWVGGWLSYCYARAHVFDDEVWEVEDREPWHMRTYDDPPDMIVVQLTAVHNRLPHKRIAIEMPASSELGQSLIVGRQVRLNAKQRFPLTIVPWHKLYEIRPLWRRYSWQRTSFGNYVVKLQAWPVIRSGWGDRSYPGDTVAEAYAGMSESVSPLRLPPLAEFEMDESEPLDPPEERAALRLMAQLAEQRDGARRQTPDGTTVH
jgi:hypothetical protein